MAGMFAAWPRRILIALVVVAGCVALFLFASTVVKAEQMVASWYGPGFEGATTASGEPFDPYDYTAASKTYDFGTRLIVTYEGRSVVVRVNDRGPYVDGRDLDLSQGAAEYLGLTAVGYAPVNVEVADPGTPTGPYGGTKKVRRKAPAEQSTLQAEEPVQRDTRQAPAGSEQQAETGQQAEANQPQEKARQDFAGTGEDQYAAADQYTEEVVVEEAVPPAPPAPKPAVPVLPPEPEPAALEAPPKDLAVPNSTVERRVELAVAAPPEPAPEPAPEPTVEPASAEPVAQEEPEPVVEDTPKPEKPEATGPGGITVLPDTGGAPAGFLLSGVLLLGSGIAVRVLRR